MKSKLIMLLACLFLAACQVQPSPSPLPPTVPALTSTPTRPAVTPTLQTTPTPELRIQVDPSALRGVKLELWHPLGGEQAKALKTIVDDFNQNNIWGITANLVALYSLTALDEQITLNLTEKKLPRVVIAPPEMIAGMGSSLRIIADASPYLGDAEWGLAGKESADLVPQFWTPAAQRLSLPLLRDATGLFYNQSLARQMGYTQPPATPEDFRVQACAASSKSLNDDTFDNDGQGGWFLERDPLTLISWMSAFNASLTEAPTGQIKFNAQSSADAFTFLRRLLDSACAWTSKTASASEVFSQRRALFYSGSLGNLLLQERLQKMSKSSDQWSLLAYPSLGKKPLMVSFGMDGAILNGAPAEQLAGWLLLRWMLLPRSQAQLALAGGTLPVRLSAFSLMKDFGSVHPQWNEAAQNLPWLKPAPESATWRQAQRILEDAAWQIFQPYVAPSRIPAILAELDATLEELLKRNP